MITAYIPAGTEAFAEALPLMLKFEGGYCDDANDSGGPTCNGIIQREYDRYRRKKGLPLQSVALITDAETHDIYLNEYYLAAACNSLPRRTAIAVFDWQVNSGRGVTTLQQCLGVTADGVVGHQTLNELTYWLSKPSGEDRLLHNYFELRDGCYRRRWGVGSQSGFLQGWLNRSVGLREYLEVKDA